MSDNKIPTAEDFIVESKPGNNDEWISFTEVQTLMIEFAKLHVKEALKQASEKVSGHSVTPVMGGTPIFRRVRIDGKSILNAYPLDLIK